MDFPYFSLEISWKRWIFSVAMFVYWRQSEILTIFKLVKQIATSQTVNAGIFSKIGHWRLLKSHWSRFMILAFRLRFVVFFCVWQALGMPWKSGSLDPWWSDHLWMFFCCNISLCWSWITKEQIQKIGGKDRDTLSTSESAIVLKIHRGNSLCNVLTSTDFNVPPRATFQLTTAIKKGATLRGMVTRGNMLLEGLEEQVLFWELQEWSF